MLTEAAKILGGTPAQRLLLQQYAQQKQTMETAVKEGRNAEAIDTLRQLRGSAISLVMPVRANKERTQRQTEQFNEMAPVLGLVGRTAFKNPAITGSKAIIKESLSPGKEFTAYLKQLAVVEGLQALAPKDRKDNNAQTVITACETLGQYAQVYFDHYTQDLKSSQQKDKKSLRKKQICKEGLKLSRHLAIATQFSALPQPSEQKPWSQAQDLSMTQLRTQFIFESDYK